MIKPFEQELEFEKDLTWSDVFEIWRENEEERENWKCYWKEQGFDSWEEWRNRYATPFKLSEREWKLYFVKSPLMAVPKFRGGPFLTWVEKYYNDEPAPTFAELIKQPDLQNQAGVIDIMEHFPPKTTITAVETDAGIVIVEGMHRCLAIALAAEKHLPINAHLTLALGSKLPGELPVIGKMRKEDPE